MLLFKNTRSQTFFWFSFSLTLAAIYAFLILQRAFDGNYVVQDDVRQHVFWMQRFTQPALFPHDLIADYFQSLAPWGYSQLYRGFAAIGIEPLVLSKLLPLPLSLITAAYAFGVGMQLLPLPFAGFVASLLTTQVLWTHDDVVSATPRAFLPPLFMAFLYYLLRRDVKPEGWRSLLPCLGVIGLEGLFYPQYVLVFACIVLLQLVTWRRAIPKVASDRSTWIFCGACLGMAVLALLPIALSSSAYGAVVSGAAARQMPEFSEIGRNAFFLEDPLQFWLFGDRSGMFPSFRPRFLAIGFLLPLLPLVRRYPVQFPLAQRVNGGVMLVQIVVVALALFFAAHALLFKLYLPSRYTAYTLRFALVFAAAIVITIGLNALWQWLQRQVQPALRLPVWGVTLALCGGLVFYPSYAKSQAIDSYSTGDESQLYQFFAQQPSDTLIASVVRAVDNFPTFSGRSIFVGREYALPYHVDYASQIRQRAIDTIQAQYSLEAAPVDRFIRTHGIDFWILDRKESFNRTLLQKAWIRQYPEALAEALQHLKQGTPVLKKLVRPCIVRRDQEMQVLSAACILEKINRSN